MIVRSAFRSLCRAPGFTAAAVLTVGIGMGAALAVYAVVYGVLLRPLDYSNPERLSLFNVQRDVAGRRTTTSMSLTPEDVEVIRENTRVLESVSAFSPVAYAMSTGEQSVSIRGALVSRDFFATMAGTFVAGRPLGPGDEMRPVVVISYRMWREYHGSSSTVLGREILLDSLAYEIVGVAGERFRFPDASSHRFSGDTDVWTPMEFALATMADFRDGRRERRAVFDIVARVRAGSSRQDAARDLTEVFGRPSHGTAFSQYQGVMAIALQGRLLGDAERLLGLLFVAGVLFVAGAGVNVVGLSVARAAANSEEERVKLALGAKVRSLVAESLMRSVLLVLVGTIVAVALAVWSVGVLRAWDPAGVPRLAAVRVDGPVLSLGALVAIVITAATGFLPPWLSRGPLRTSDRARVTGGKRTRSVRRVLVVSQIALSCVLLVLAVHTTRIARNLLDTDLGVVTEGAVAVSVDLARDRTAFGYRENEMLERILSRIRSAPGLEAAGAATVLPPTGSTVRALYRHFSNGTGQAAEYLLDLVPTTPGFMAALGISLVEGRVFDAADTADTRRVAILNVNLARRLFGSRTAVGRTLNFSRDGVTVVGVVGNVSNRGLGRAPGDTVYVPFAQNPRGRVEIVARTSSDASVEASALRNAIGAVDERLAIATVRSLDEVLRRFTDGPQLRAGVLSALAIVGVALAGVSLYGLVAFTVSQRMREFGIRLAIGATPGAIQLLVMREAFWLTLIGVGGGLGGAVALVRLSNGVLFDGGSGEVTGLWTAGAALWLVSVVSSYIPAARASRVNALLAVRAE